MKTFKTVNPMTGETLETHEFLSPAGVEAVLQEAQNSFLHWRKEPLSKRAQVLKSLAKALRENGAKLSQIMTAEMGKPILQARSEVEKCAVTFEYFAEHGPEFLKPLSVLAQYQKNEIHLQPLGVIFAIMPWNFPLWQAVRFAAPALMVGNVIVLKHSEITAGTSKLLVEVLKSAYEKPLIFDAPVDHETAALTIAHKTVRGVTFTGSTAGGRSVAEVAGKNLKKIVLELGGSDPYLVLADADLEKTAKICFEARIVNSGQSCVAAKRFIVEKSVAPIFKEKFIEHMKQAKVGDPKDESTEIGPLAAKKFQKLVAGQVDKLIGAGGQLLCGGSVPEGPGAFFSPTVLSFTENHPLLRTEEVFAPVALVIEVDHAEQAVQVANSAIYGLGGAVFTKNLETGRKIALQIESGFVVVNDSVKSDPRLPFGGVKDSGYGRELSQFGLQEFCNIKSLGLNA